MPYLTFDTNAEITVTSEMLMEATVIVAETLNKPMDYIITSINVHKSIEFGGRNGAIGALVEMKSVGYGNNKGVLAKMLTDFAVKYFNAEAPLVGIHFVDMPAATVAHNGILM